jgi:hypothetical protein
LLSAYRKKQVPRSERKSAKWVSKPPLLNDMSQNDSAIKPEAINPTFSENSFLHKKYMSTTMPNPDVKDKALIPNSFAPKSATNGIEKYTYPGEEPPLMENVIGRKFPLSSMAVLRREYESRVRVSSSP